MISYDGGMLYFAFKRLVHEVVYEAVFQTVRAALGDGELIIVPEVICMAGLAKIVCWEPVPEVRRSEGSPGEDTAQLLTSGAKYFVQPQ